MSFEAVMPPYNASDPTATFLSASCLDFLLIELVPMAYRVTNELEASASSAQGGTSAAATEKDASSAAPRAAMDEEEERDAVFYRLETLGYRVGQGLVERYVSLSHGMLCVVCCNAWWSLSVGVVAVPACLPPSHNNRYPKSSARKVGT